MTCTRSMWLQQTTRRSLARIARPELARRLGRCSFCGRVNGLGHRTSVSNTNIVHFHRRKVLHSVLEDATLASTPPSRARRLGRNRPVRSSSSRRMRSAKHRRGLAQQSSRRARDRLRDAKQARSLLMQRQRQLSRSMSCHGRSASGLAATLQTLAFRCRHRHRHGDRSDRKTTLPCSAHA